MGGLWNKGFPTPAVMGLAGVLLLSFFLWYISILAPNFLGLGKGKKWVKCFLYFSMWPSSVFKICKCFCFFFAIQRFPRAILVVVVYCFFGKTSVRTF